MALKMTIEEAIDLVYEVLKDRNEKYGDENLTDYGVLGLLIRMSDKLARLRYAIEHDNKDIVQDVLIDIAGYAINGLRILERHDAIMGRYMSEYELARRND